MNLDWHDAAACKNWPAEWWFPRRAADHPGEVSSIYAETEQAKKICGDCPSRKPCLDFALSNKEEFGIWGGLGEKARTHLRKNNGRPAVCLECRKVFVTRTTSAYCGPGCRGEARRRQHRESHVRRQSA